MTVVTSTATASASATASTDEVDLERRFGGLRRLHGEAAYARLRSLLSLIHI